MSFFAHPFFQPPTVTSSSSFHPLFRLLDDFDSYSRCAEGAKATNGNARHKSQASSVRTFTPRFDVQEHNEGYELHGEFPGIDQKDVEVEFTDENVLTVRGRTERHTSSNSLSQDGQDKTVEATATPAAITTGEEGRAKSPRNATVEDEVDQSTGRPTPEQSEAELVTHTNEEQHQSVQKAAAHPSSRYWVSERSIGEFSRSFTFPVRVDQEAVEASMRNGVLRIWVPKAKKLESRKITIS